jgi:ectoine hydroxylase
MSSRYIGDLYPSRYREIEQVFSRVEPVVYAPEAAWCNAPAPLDSNTIASYDENGFLLLENIFTPEEIDLLCKEAATLRQDNMIRRREEIILEPDSKDIRSIFDIQRFSHAFRDIVTDKRLTSIASFLLNGSVYLHQCRLNYKPGFRGKEFYWHSDFETWHVEDGMPSMRALSISIALTENHVCNGPVMVIPGSQRHFVSCAGSTPEDNFKTSLRQQVHGVPSETVIQKMVEANGITTITAKPGSILIFDCNTLHGSAGNITPFPRNNLFIVYNAVENQLKDPFCNQQMRPEYVAHRQVVTAIDAWPCKGTLAH